MRILIVEDEPPIARDIERNCKTLLQEKVSLTHICYSLDDAIAYLSSNNVDLCLLDLNLNKKDGFELLQEFSSYSFHTIIISAHTDKAIEAFKYGVLDFVPKPLKQERLKTAFDRFLSKNKSIQPQIEFLVARKQTNNIPLRIEEIKYFSAADNYVNVHMKNGRTHMMNKSMESLEQLLPPNYMRIHRSYIINLECAKSYKHSGGGKYIVELSNEIALPVSRNKYKELSEGFGNN